MSKEFTKEDVIQNKKEGIKVLNKLLEGYINDSTKSSEKHLKKAHLISYWLKDFVRYIRFEETFEPSKNISYKRGNIIKANFGFNVGSEYGGLHYAIVLDIANAHNSPTLTVIPLTSVKESKAVHNNSVKLGNEIYKLLYVKFVTIFKHVEEQRSDIEKTLSNINVLLSVANKSLDKLEVKENPTPEDLEEVLEITNQIEEINKMQVELQNKLHQNDEELNELEKIKDEILRMKEGSIALVNQITTISKIRIMDPKNTKGVLSGISLSAEAMNKINEKVKELYVFSIS